MKRSLQEVIRDVCKSTAKELSNLKVDEINFQFGDSVYINTKLIEMAQIQMNRFPLIGLFPFEEHRGISGIECEAELDLIIACQTVAGYDNWQRHDISFNGFLRIIYDEFMRQLKQCTELDFGNAGEIEHIYKENYAYGSRGVMDSEKRDLPELIDAIEIKNMKVKLKSMCYGTSERVW
ncbi:hypothetical protein [Bacteroides sp.]|uniref:hypothetical protein n=1 Tax=Bacteroides sp. TaxID=29523 RepID=UPI002FCC036D